MTDSDVSTLETLYQNLLLAVYHFCTPRVTRVQMRSHFKRTDNGFGVTTTVEPDYSWVIVENHKDVIALPAFIEFYKFIDNDEDLRGRLIFRLYGLADDTEESKQRPLWEHLYHLAHDLFPIIANSQDWATPANAVLHQMLEHSKNRRAPRVRITPLICVKLVDGPIQIGQYTLRDITQEEIDALVDIFGKTEYMLGQIETVLERRMDGPLSADPVIWLPGSEDDVLNLLRLHYDAYCWSLPTTEWMDSPFGVARSSFSKATPTLRVRGQKPTVEIRIEDATQLNELLTRCVRSSSNKAFQIAWRRWGFANEREEDADRILDYWIGIEALFGDKGSETSFKLALRFAGFVGCTPDERIALFVACKKAYGVRSDIAHGNSKLNEAGLKAAVVTARTFAKRALSATIQCEATVDTKSFELQLLKRPSDD